MFKKTIAAIAAAAVLIATPAIAGFSNRVDNGVGRIASHKSLEIQHIDGDAWVMVEDNVRVDERLANHPGYGPPPQIIGIHKGNGNYLIYIQMGFFHMPMGVMNMDVIKTIVPIFETLDGMYPRQFITFATFEDIWVYMDTTEEQEAYVLSVIRELNNRALEAEDVR
jgi:hypothetical protein